MKANPKKSLTLQGFPVIGLRLKKNGGTWEPKTGGTFFFAEKPGELFPRFPRFPGEQKNTGVVWSVHTQIRLPEAAIFTADLVSK